MSTILDSPSLFVIAASMLATTFFSGCATPAPKADTTAQSVASSTVVHSESTAETTAVVIVNGHKSAEPIIVRNAELREAIRQQTTWTSENIAKNPYLFIQDQIRQCDSLKAKIEAQSITLTRMGKEAARKVEEADGMKARYTRFLAAANAAYDEAEASGKWPIAVNGYKMDEDELGDKMDDAQTRIELAEKQKAQYSATGQKVEIRQGALKRKRRELSNLRLKLVQQAEQVKMNAALAEIEGLQNVLATIIDMMVEIDEDPTKLSIDDLAAGDTDAAKKARIKAIRESYR